MPALQFEGISVVGDDALDYGISDLQIVMGPTGQPVLLAVNRSEGGVTSWGVSANGLPDLASAHFAGATPMAGITPSLIALSNGTAPEALIAGFDGGSVYSVDTNSDDSVDAPSWENTTNRDWSVGTQLSTGQVALASGTGSGFSIFDISGSGQLSLDFTRSDAVAAYADQISAMAAVEVGGNDFLIVASVNEMGVSAYEIGASSAQLIASVGSAQGMGIMVPTALEVTEIGGQAFVVLASATGGNGALSVMQVTAAGELIPTDHVLDTLDSRFGQVQDIAVAAYGDVALVVAGGGDDGLSLLLITQDGRLVHLDAYEDSLQSGLTDVSEIEMIIFGDTAQIIVATAADAGLTTMTVDLSDLGLVGSAEGVQGMFSGTGKDDVLIASADADTLYGNVGNDIFVMTADGAPEDIILGFVPSQDRIDLSDWPQLYDTGSLTIWTTATGARIQWRDETVFVRGVDGQPLDAEEVRAAIDIDVNRIPSTPQISRTGDNSDNSLDGSWGEDTLIGNGGADWLSGGAGDDSISAGAGYDTLFGGSGADTLFAGTGNDTIDGGYGDDIIHGEDGFDIVLLDVASDEIEILEIGDDYIILSSAFGVDTIHGVEQFVFTDATLKFVDLLPPVGPAEVLGTSGADQLEYLDGDAIVMGYEGDDILTTGDGNDELQGGADNDTIVAGRGNDYVIGGAGDDNAWGEKGNDHLVGGWGKDSLRGGSGADTLDGDGGNDLLKGGGGDDILIGDGGDDVLRGQGGNDTLNGGPGDDNIKGGGGRDLHYGDGGHDTIKGGGKKDTLYGDSGNDKLWGDRANDKLFGGSGNDKLKGGGGNDKLEGGSGDDFLKGGKGADTFIFDVGHDADEIADFDLAADKIVLSQELIGAMLTAADVVESFATTLADGVQLDFGDGDTIFLDGLQDLNGLSNVIDVA